MPDFYPEGAQDVGRDEHGDEGQGDALLPQFDLLTALTTPQNVAKSRDGAYREVGYAIQPAACGDIWRLKIHGQCIDTRSGESRLSELLDIGFSTTESMGQRVKWVTTRGYSYTLSDALVFRAFMAASVIIARVDAGQCPDVLKILRVYGLRKHA